MGRLLLLLLLVATFVLLWKAFGPGTWRRSDNEVEPLIKGPDDDEEFLWRLELEQFKNAGRPKLQQRPRRNAVAVNDTTRTREANQS